MSMKKLICAALLLAVPAMGADNFFRGEQFDGRTGLVSGAALEDLVTEATFTFASGLTNNAPRLFDGFSLWVTNNVFGASTNYVLSVKTNGITGGHILDGTITGADIADGTITSTEIEPGTIDRDNVRLGGGVMPHIFTNSANRLVTNKVADVSFQSTAWVTIAEHTNWVPDGAYAAIFWRNIGVGDNGALGGRLQAFYRTDKNSDEIQIGEVTVRQGYASDSDNFVVIRLSTTNTFDLRFKVPTTAGISSGRVDYAEFFLNTVGYY